MEREGHRDAGLPSLDKNAHNCGTQQVVSPGREIGGGDSELLKGRGRSIVHGCRARTHGRGQRPRSVQVGI